MARNPWLGFAIDGWRRQPGSWIRPTEDRPRAPPDAAWFGLGSPRASGRRGFMNPRSIRLVRLKFAKARGSRGAPQAPMPVAGTSARAIRELFFLSGYPSTTPRTPSQWCT